MIFNFSKKSQFTTKLNVLNTDIDMVKETTLLGTIITDQLNWDRNTEELTKKGYKRMQLLNAVSTFTKNRTDLKNIYLTFIRSVVEQSAVVWHSSLTVRNRKDIERIQKVCIKIILGSEYTTYSDALDKVGLQTLHDRREKRCLDFAKKCLNHPVHKNLFPLNNIKPTVNASIRHREPFIVNFARTESYKRSAIPFCQRILNTNYKKSN